MLNLAATYSEKVSVYYMQGDVFFFFFFFFFFQNFVVQISWCVLCLNYVNIKYDFDGSFG